MPACTSLGHRCTLAVRDHMDLILRLLQRMSVPLEGYGMVRLNLKGFAILGLLLCARISPVDLLTMDHPALSPMASIPTKSSSWLHLQHRGGCLPTQAAASIFCRWSHFASGSGLPLAVRKRAQSCCAFEIHYVALVRSLCVVSCGVIAPDERLCRSSKHRMRQSRSQIHTERTYLVSCSEDR